MKTYPVYRLKKKRKPSILPVVIIAILAGAGIGKATDWLSTSQFNQDHAKKRISVNPRTQPVKLHTTELDAQAAMIYLYGDNDNINYLKEKEF